MINKKEKINKYLNKNPRNSQLFLLWSFEAPCKYTESSVFSNGTAEELVPKEGLQLSLETFLKDASETCVLQTISVPVSTPLLQDRSKKKSLHRNIFYEMNKCTTSDFCSIGSTFTFLFRKNGKFLENANKAPLLCIYLAVSFNFSFQVDIIQSTKLLNETP